LPRTQAGVGIAPDAGFVADYNQLVANPTGGPRKVDKGEATRGGFSYRAQRPWTAGHRVIPHAGAHHKTSMTLQGGVILHGVAERCPFWWVVLLSGDEILFTIQHSRLYP